MSPELQEARGNPGKRPIRKVTRVRGKRAAIERPKWLSETIAKQVWLRLSGSLHWLRREHADVFGRYCVYIANWVEATKEIRKGGMVYETSSAHVENMLRINPWFTVRSRIEDDLVKLEEKLGLTPIDRQKVIAGMAALASGQFSDLFGDDGDDEGASDAESPTADVPAPVIPAEMPTVGALSNKLN